MSEDLICLDYNLDRLDDLVQSSDPHRRSKKEFDWGVNDKCRVIHTCLGSGESPGQHLSQYVIHFKDFCSLPSSQATNTEAGLPG